jgi:hypothetical protein
MSKNGAGNRFPFWLAEACAGARKISGAGVGEVAELAGVARSAIHRFENQSPWPKDPEVLVAAYAKATGRDDSRELWRIALGLWERYGHDRGLPVTDAERVRLTASQLEQQLDEWAQKRQQERASESEHRVGPRRQVG